MSLIDKLRTAGAVLRDAAPSHVPNVNELADVVGALIAHAEHGESLFEAASQGGEAIVKLLSPVAVDAVEAADPAATPIVQEAEKVAGEVATDAGAAAQASAASGQPDKLDLLLQAVEGLAGAIAAQQHPVITSAPAPADKPAGFYPGAGE